MNVREEIVRCMSCGLEEWLGRQLYGLSGNDTDCKRKVGWMRCY